MKTFSCSVMMAVAAVGMASCAGAPARFSGNAAIDTIPLAMRQQTFDIVWNTINEKLWDPAILAQRDWPGIRQRYMPRALATSNSIEFHRVLNDMTKELHFSHFAVMGPAGVSDAWARTRTATGDAGMQLRMIDSVSIVTHVVAGGGADRAGIRAGFAIDSIDGRVPAVNPLVQLEGALGSTVRISMRDSGDVRRTASVTRTARSGKFHRITLFGIPVPGIPAQYGEVESRRLDGGVGYLRFSMFLQPLRKDVIRAMRSMSDAQGIIIDLRGNPGGQDGMGRRVANLLVERKTAFVVTHKRAEDETFYLEPDEPAYKGKVVILLDGGSGSASEQFAAGLQEIGRATIVGEQSMGRDLDATLQKLPTGGMLQYAYGEVRTPKGLVVEGRGVTPDVPVKLTRASLLAGRDAQLDQAVALILLSAAK